MAQCLGIAICSLVANAADRQHTVVARGPHHRVWQKTHPVILPDGRTVNRTSEYTELGTGLNYWTGRAWADSKEEIELVDGGAVAQHGQHKVSFAANINSMPALQLNTPDQKTFRTRILGIAYYDPVTGRSELIGELRDAIGELIAPNQIIYRDCFLGVKADVRFTYTKAGFEQDIILRERVNPPAFYQLSEHSRIQVWTELFDPPTPTKQTRVLRREENPARRLAMAEPDFKDDMLNFGHMHMTRGKGFSIESDVGAEPEESITIGKEWARIDGRDFLIESAEHSALEPLLETLPAAVTAKRLRPEGKKHLTRSELIGMLSRIQPKERDHSLQIARVDARHDKGVVLDYLLMSSQTNFTFRGDSTYFVSSSVALSGTTTIHGGVVVKATNASASSLRLMIQGTVDCQTSAFRPAVFTGKDDDSIGEVISGSTGNPTTNYYGSYIYLGGNTNAIDLHDVRLRHAYIGFYLNGSSGLTVRNAGTTNINPQLLADLRKKTTYPPIVFSTNTIGIDTVLSQQAGRDVDVPDLGFHYDPLDYLVHYCTVTNATVLLTNGVAVGTVGWPGFWLYEGGRIVSEGTPLTRNHIARYNTVQENPLNWGSATPDWAASVVAYPQGQLATGRFRFTDFDTMSAAGYHFIPTTVGGSALSRLQIASSTAVATTLLVPRTQRLV